MKKSIDNEVIEAKELLIKYKNINKKYTELQDIKKLIEEEKEKYKDFKGGFWHNLKKGLGSKKEEEL